MAFDYSEIAQDALDLITEFGSSVNLIRRSVDPADASKPWRGSEDSETSTISPCVIIPIKDSQIVPQTAAQRDSISVAFVPGSETGDVRGTHFIDDSDSVRWRVLDVETYKPGPVPLLYILFLAR